MVALLTRPPPLALPKKPRFTPAARPPASDLSEVIRRSHRALSDGSADAPTAKRAKAELLRALNRPSAFRRIIVPPLTRRPGRRVRHIPGLARLLS